MVELANWTEIGARVEERRKELKFTKKAMSEFLGVSVKTYSKMEQGKKEFSIIQMQGLCTIFHISPEYFLTGEMGMLECSELIRNVQKVSENARKVDLNIAQYLYVTEQKKQKTKTPVK